MSYNRIFLIVLDSFGIGNAPDAESFGDLGANTLKSISKAKGFNIPNLKKLGLCNIDGVELENEALPLAEFGALQEKSAGKDTTIGHFEIAGVVSQKPMPTYPKGFPTEIIAEFEKQTGRGTLCNKPYSGTKVIADFGDEHLKTGKLIVYTSADSVFQIAAHTSLISGEELYEYGKSARRIVTGDHAVGRVIARPFTGEYPFTRTADRHDFSVEPPENTMLDILKANAFDVISVGKIADIFAHRGFTEEHFTHSNSEGMSKTLEMLKKDFKGLCFTNVVDFDMKFGHRRDVEGYANAISEFDAWLCDFIPQMRGDDLLIITADHGCDPAFSGTDHTREKVPLLIYSEKIKSANLGTVTGFDFISKYILNNFG